MLDCSYLLINADIYFTAQECDATKAKYLFCR